MSNFTFTWPAGPKDVIVTGTFDEWTQSLPLIKQKDGSFELTVPFPKQISEKILFKFVVDGEWTTSSKYKTSPDGSGHENNVLDSDDFVSTKDVKSSIPEAGGLAVPAVIATSVKKTLDPKAESSTFSTSKEPELSTTVLPSSEGKQVTLGEPGVVVPEDPHAISAFSEIRDVDPKTLNEPETPSEPELSTTVLPSSEGEQVTSGEPGVVVPEDPHAISAFSEIRDVDPKTLNEPEISSTAVEGSAASPTTEETKPKYAKKVLKKVKKSTSPESTSEEPIVSTTTDGPVAEQVKAAADEPVTTTPVVASSAKKTSSTPPQEKKKKEKKSIFSKIKKVFK